MCDPLNHKVQSLSSLANIQKQCLDLSLLKERGLQDLPDFCEYYSCSVSHMEIARDGVLKNIFLSHGHDVQLSLRLLQPRSTSHIEWECQAVGVVPPEGQRVHLEARYLYSCYVCFSAWLEQEIPNHLP